MTNFLQTFIFGATLLTCSISSGTTTDAEIYFKSADLVSAKLSPDGNKIAKLSNVNSGQTININFQGKDRLIYTLDKSKNTDSQVLSIDWIDNHNIAIDIILEIKGADQLKDTRYISDLKIINIDNHDQVFSVRTSGEIIDPLPEETGAFLYSKTGLTSRIYKIKIDKLALTDKKLGKLDRIDGGQFIKSNEITSIPGRAVRWINHNKNLHSVIIKDNHHTYSLKTLKDKNWELVKTWDFRQGNSKSNTNEVKYIPIAATSTPDTYFCIDSNEEKKQSIYKVNFNTDTAIEVYNTESYKIINTQIDDSGEEISQLTVIRDGKVSFEYPRINKALPHSNSNYINIRMGTSLNNKYELIYQEKFDQPGSFYKINKSTNKKTYIGSNHPNLRNRINASQISSKIDINDLEIPYILTTPDNKNKIHPLIVMPHGGPIGVHDTPYFEPKVQFFIAQGYAVLRVNHRGSSGYDNQFIESGKKQWGDLILNDIHQATLTVSELNNIDSERICSYGASYGGYAAIMLAITHPDVYKCSASFAGVTDINLYINTARSASAKSWLEEYVGDSSRDYEKLKQQSPVYLIESLKTPTFISHGNNDDVVDIEHAHRVISMLKKYNKNYETHIIDGEGHGFESDENAIIFYNKLSTFIEKYI